MCDNHVSQVDGWVTVTKRAIILVHDDLTSNIVMSALMDVVGLEIVGIFYTASPTLEKSGWLTGAMTMRKKMAFSYWFYLIIQNGLYRLLRGFRFFVSTERRQKIPCLRTRALSTGIGIDTRESFNGDDFIRFIQENKIDLVITRIGEKLSSRVLSAPQMGVLCLHSGLLPAYKGIAGEFHAMRAGEKYAGSTLFVMNDEIDMGTIVGQTKLELDYGKSVFHNMVRNNLAAREIVRDKISIGIEEGGLEEAPRNNYQPSYFSWPSSEHMGQLRKRRVPLMMLFDCFSIIRLMILGMRDE